MSAENYHIRKKEIALKALENKKIIDEAIEEHRHKKIKYIDNPTLDFNFDEGLIDRRSFHERYIEMKESIIIT